MSKWENILHNHQDINVVGMLNKLWSKKRFGYSLPPDILKHSDERKQIQYLLSKFDNKRRPTSSVVGERESRVIGQYERLFNQFEDVKLRIKKEPIIKYTEYKRQERLKLIQVAKKVKLLEKLQEKATEQLYEQRRVPLEKPANKTSPGVVPITQRELLSNQSSSEQSMSKPHKFNRHLKKVAQNTNITGHKLKGNDRSLLATPEPKKRDPDNQIALQQLRGKWHSTRNLQLD